MQKVNNLLNLLGFTLATQHKAEHALAQTSQSTGLPKQIFDPDHVSFAIDYADTAALCELSTTTIEECIEAMKVDFDDNWPRLDAYFNNQIGCWRELASDLGFQSFSEFTEFPWNNVYSAVHMPNTRHYEHFYDTAGCNQIWELGRGRIQPDAITFYDVPAHEHNVLLSRERMSLTPWVTHDERVLQFFGITDTCVELYVENENEDTSFNSYGQGLATNQWRIEYYNSMDGHTSFNSTDLYDVTELSYFDANTWGDIEGDSLSLCRTPFYMQVCVIEAGPINGAIGGCDGGCVYFPAFTATDASLFPFVDENGRYDVHCEAGDIMSFDGTIPDGSTIGTPELWFEDKCDSENFIMLGGQEIHLAGNFTGTLEVLIPDSLCGAGTYDATAAITYYQSMADVATFTTWTYATLCMAFIGSGQPRFFVSAKKDTIQMCFGQCNSDPTLNCPIGFDSSTGGGDPETTDRFVVGGETVVPTVVDGGPGNNYYVATNGRVVIEGNPGNDILEDHNAEALLVGGNGNDRLISRNGRDALIGGNMFGLLQCDNTDTGGEVDKESNGCSWYEMNAQYCGNYDDDDFTAKTLCCICGGGNCGAGDPTVIAATNVATTFATDGEIDDLGDSDTYVIYPTTEKSLYRSGFFADFHSVGNNKNRQGDCTKVFGFDKQDTLEFRIDDQTVEDYKFTDEDDECAFEVDGWELIWWLGDDYIKADVGGQTDVILTSLDIYFSRKDRKVAICPYDDMTQDQKGIPEGAVTDPVEASEYQHYMGKCRDIDSDCIEYDVECPDLLNEIDVDDYLKNTSVLNWYGWF